MNENLVLKKQKFKTLVRKIKKGRKKDKGNKIEKNLKWFIKSCN